MVSRAEFVSVDGAEGKVSDLPAKVLRALFDEVTGTKEFHHSTDNRSCKIERDDICQLCMKLAQWVEHLHPAAAGFRFVVIYKHDSSGHQSRENIGSYQNFINHDFGGTVPISCVEIYFNFVAPGRETGQSAAYTVNADLHGFVLKRDSSNAMFGLSSYAFPPFSNFGLDLRVEYVDYLVAKNLEVLVKNWYQDLPDYSVP